MGRAVTVRAPARLHLGFLDPNGTSGRRFGSIGVALEGIGTEVQVRPARRLEVKGEERERARAFLTRFLQQTGLSEGVAVEVRRAIPPHAGLGSGTQLRLALGVAVSRLFERGLSPREVALLAGRGLRSGIGVAAFEEGGFLVDGGRSEGTGVPPRIARLPVPSSWRWLLLLDTARKGLHGEQERLAFRRPGFFPPSLVDQLSRKLWVGLAALAEGRRSPFAALIDAVQEANGRYFSPIQGGLYASQAVAEALAFLKAEGCTGLGQSSWGPTGFCLFSSQEEAERMLPKLRRRFGEKLTFQIVASRNRGAEISVEER